ncbi:hypothetical protein ISS21_02425 [Patescibacteria group bacterium]|nr:hypothetical protein [Patescibacteria group bacterium]
MKKVAIIFLILLTGGFIGYLIFNIQNPGFEKLNPTEQYEKIINQRNQAIAQAVKAGVYKCCINPPCTMCYSEANQWNNHKAGTCACDDLIAQGKEPCPQCKRGLIRDTGSSCEIISGTCEPEVNN